MKITPPFKLRKLAWIVAFSTATPLFILTATKDVFAADAVTKLDEVYVTANRLEKPLSTVPNTVTVIDADLIEQQSNIDGSIAGILEKTVPGFAPSSQKMSGGAETLRGKNALYVIDGVPQHNPLRDGLRDGFTIDSDFLERIEVVQGANAIQGVGATGGVINMTTRQARGEEGKWQNEVKIKMATDDGFDSDSFSPKLTYIGSIRDAEKDLVIGASKQSTGLFFDGDGNRVGYRTAQGELQDSEARSLFVKFGYNLDQDQRIQVMVNDYELENNGDLLSVAGDRDTGLYTSSEDGDASAVYADPAKNDVTTVTLDYSHDDLMGGIFRGQMYFNDYKALYEGSLHTRWALTTGGAAFLDQSQIESEKTGLKLSWEKDKVADLEGLRTIVGFDYAKDKSAQTLKQTGRYWVPEMVLQTTSPFVQADYQATDELLFSAGLRYEVAKLIVDDFTTLPVENNTEVDGGNPDFNEALKNIGLVYDINDNIAVYASYSESFDMPDVGRVLRAIDDPGMDVDDFIDLEPVLTDNYEIGLNFDKGSWSAQVSVYQSKTDLGSRLNEDSNGIYTVNREKQERQGYTLSLAYELNHNWNFGANYSHMEGEYDSDGDGKVDTDLDNQNNSPDRLNLYAQANFDKLSGHLQVSNLLDRKQSGKAVRSDHRGEFNGYTLVDLGLNYDTQYGEFGLGIENLMDETYETLYSQYQSTNAYRYFSGRGRTLNLSYKVNW